MTLSRRSMFAGMAAAIAAPAIIRTPGLIMPIKPQLLVPSVLQIKMDLWEAFIGKMENHILYGDSGQPRGGFYGLA